MFSSLSSLHGYRCGICSLNFLFDTWGVQAGGPRSWEFRSEWVVIYWIPGGRAVRLWVSPWFSLSAQASQLRGLKAGAGDNGEKSFQSLPFL